MSKASIHERFGSADGTTADPCRRPVLRKDARTARLDGEPWRPRT